MSSSTSTAVPPQLNGDADSRVDGLRAFFLANQLPLGQALGMRLELLEPGRTVFALDASTLHANPMGTVHGGVLTTIADSAMGVAYTSTLQEGESFTTLELKVNFMRPHREGRLTAEAQVKQGGRTVGLVECHVRDEQNRLIAYATSTCMTLRGDQAAGRMPNDVLPQLS
jgi:uncharacterized protein (TIGR00369 family)